MVADAPSGDVRRAAALNEACFDRVLSGLELKAAVPLCDEAIRLKPDEAFIRDSRAQLRLRLGEWKGAQDDYDEVLKRRIGNASALYGRSIAERRLGETGKADADLAAAKRAKSDIETRFADWTPPA